jgi:hypothetical protein
MPPPRIATFILPSAMVPAPAHVAPADLHIGFQRSIPPCRYRTKGREVAIRRRWQAQPRGSQLFVRRNRAHPGKTASIRRTAANAIERYRNVNAAEFNRPRAAGRSLLEHRPAGLAEAGLLPPQAAGDGPDVGDFAGAETVDVGRAGPPLCRRPRFGQRRIGCEQREKETKCG